MMISTHLWHFYVHVHLAKARYAARQDLLDISDFHILHPGCFANPASDFSEQDSASHTVIVMVYHYH